MARAVVRWPDGRVFEPCPRCGKRFEIFKEIEKYISPYVSERVKNHLRARTGKCAEARR